MRGLKTSDVFKAMRVVNAAGIREEVKRIALLANEGKFSVSEVGLEFVLSCVDGLSNSKSEKMIYEFLAGPLECTAEEIENDDPLALVDKIKSLSAVIDMDGWKAFFMSVASLIR